MYKSFQLQEWALGMWKSWSKRIEHLHWQLFKELHDLSWLVSGHDKCINMIPINDDGLIMLLLRFRMS